jgi:hypothetical protein
MYRAFRNAAAMRSCSVFAKCPQNASYDKRQETNYNGEKDEGFGERQGAINERHCGVNYRREHAVGLEEFAAPRLSPASLG